MEVIKAREAKRLMGLEVHQRGVKTCHSLEEQSSTETKINKNT